MQSVDSLDITINRAASSRINDVDFENLPFGRVKSDHIFVARYRDGAWKDLEIRPYAEFKISPACIALHYGQSLFEGLKAFKSANGKIAVFRPRENARRIAQGASRLAMAPIPEEIFMEGLDQLLAIDRQWLPEGEDKSLYIRPFQFGDESNIGVHSSDSYTFMIFTCPTGKYYTKDVNVYVEQEYIRAAQGGIGFTKAAGNYAPTLLPAKQVKEKGYDQILWTQKIDNTLYAGEIGTMNFFVQIDDVIMTPDLDGTILPGVTRSSILQLAKDFGYQTKECPISIPFLIQAIDEGRLQDAFGAGTAAVITNIAGLGLGDKHYDLPAVANRVFSKQVREKLVNIRLGLEEDIYDWMHYV